MPRSLAQEIGKKRPFELPEEEAYLSLVRTSNDISGAFRNLFKTQGLSEAMYNVLRIVGGSGSEGRPCSEIGRDMVVRVPDVTRLVDRLEGQGLVERSRSAKDRRVVSIRITPDGETLLERLRGPLHQTLRAEMGRLSKSELKDLSLLLAKLRSDDH